MVRMMPLAPALTHRARSLTERSNSCSLHHKLRKRLPFRSVPVPVDAVRGQQRSQHDKTSYIGRTAILDLDIKARVAEEDKDAGYFKIVQWLTYPCERCTEVFTLYEQLDRHLDLCHG